MAEIMFPLLEPDDIEVKVKTVGQKGASVLLYKTSRTDMRILDETFGYNNWQDSYEVIDGTLFCTISIWDETKKQWISKCSNGIPSRADDDGNEVKGEASDAMKRAGFVVGIGRELYTAPFTFISIETKQDERGKWKLVDPFVKFIVSDIGYDEKRRINKLVIKNQKTGAVVYTFGAGASPKGAQKDNTPKGAEQPKKEEAPKPVKPATKPVAPPKETAPKQTVEKRTTLPVPDDAPMYKKLYDSFLERHNLTGEKFIEYRAKAVKAGKAVTQKSFKELTPDEWVSLLAMMEALYEEGFYNE